MILRHESVRPGDPLVELRNLSKRFVIHTESQRSIQEAFVHLLRHKRNRGREFWNLCDVSLRVDPGEAVGIIGPNGSGKSTLLKLITGIIEPTSGDILVNGRVSSLLELGAGFHGDLTGRENIFLNGSIVGLSRKEMQRQADSIIEFAELGDFIDVPVKHYSSGMYVRLGFAVAIHSQPDLLIVDEVLAVGDAAFQHKCLDAIQRFRKRGGTLLLVSHDLPTIQSICQQAIWLDRGKVRAQGGATDVAMAYLNSVAQREEDASEAEQAPPMGPGQRWGTGRVEIRDVEFCDDKGNCCTVFVEGAPMEIHLHYAAPERVEGPVFGIGIHHQNGIHICGPNTRFGQFYIPHVEGEGEVIYRIPQLALLEGGYLVSAAVVNQADTEIYDYHDRAYPFRVYPGKSGDRYGLLTLNGEWRLTNGAQPGATDPAALDAARSITG